MTAPFEMITAITVNYKTHNLTKKCIETFHAAHPKVHHILIDNFSRDESTKLLQEYRDKEGYTVIFNQHNNGHGPGMTQGIRLVKTKFFLALDSDVEVKKPFLQAMLAMFDNQPKLYAVGWLRMVDRVTGVPIEWHVKTPPSDKFIPYLHPYCGLYRIDIYRRLPQFFDHGAPCLDNMRVAYTEGWKVEQFKGINDYVTHHEAGTRRMFRGDWHPGDDRNPGGWNPNQKFPI